MAEILVEMRRPSVPMSGDLLFDRVGMRGDHWIPYVRQPNAASAFQLETVDALN
jgi:hypothetical protein